MFQSKWPLIEKQQYDGNLVLTKALTKKIVGFCQSQLEMSHPRDDYRELLELTLISLGCEPKRGVHFMAPGALHHARWMAKAIYYCLKIWVFREQLTLKESELGSLKSFCEFIVEFYVSYWFQCSISVSAPRLDLELLKSLNSSTTVLASSALNKLLLHMWYLNEELVGLAFFDPLVPINTKRKMVESLSMEKRVGRKPRAEVEKAEIESKELWDFVSKRTNNFFDAMSVSKNFLVDDPDQWSKNDDYSTVCQHLQQLKVVNDCAERGVLFVFVLVFHHQSTRRSFKAYRARP